MKAAAALLKIIQTKIGIVFAFFLPLVFFLFWMTGYNDATTRIDQLHVGLVYEASESAIAEQMTGSLPFQIEQESTLEEALDRMDNGKTDMVIALPAGLADSAHTDNGAKLTYYVNDRNSELVKSVMEKMASQITLMANQRVVPEAQALPIQAEIIKTNVIENFSTSMLPMILGFIPYIAMMTMNIQFNLSSMFLKRDHSKWSIFFGRQLIMLAVAIVASLVVSIIAKSVAPVDASFFGVWGFELLVFLACICFTQLGFALLGSAGPLFNIFFIPIQLMTAGNIISPEMLAPFYRHIGSFLPVPNGVEGAMHLVYGGGSASTYALHLVLIVIVTWGLTVLRTFLAKEKAAAPAARPAASAAH
ncbi:hypothetical protein FHS18_001789 [Paenibacillus phyllosphaerae]|uniref:ABC-2 type transporter transmembrane domain-containing protein n=1 Tax=Paenibacillus phyllosphaerae TaxID=274593 RepID=A0A7W5AWV5_9BACL|nr:ABC transporter permease [Paenibacillus phyllosphaerae]MBB3109726.1 hypothetical protein [Paenibacillus phyllosphaerae]